MSTKTNREQSKIWASYDAKKFCRYDSKLGPIKRSVWFARYLVKYNFSSVLEIGSGTGRNLRFILKKCRGITVSGIDVNEDILSLAKSKVPSADFRAIDVYDLKEDEKWDLVFTMGVLIHIHPGGIQEVIEKCINASNKYIMHIEQHGNGTILTGPKELNPEISVGRLHWKPNTVDIYNKLGFNNVSVVSIPERFLPAGRDLGPNPLYLVVVEL